MSKEDALAYLSTEGKDTITGAELRSAVSTVYDDMSVADNGEYNLCPRVPQSTKLLLRGYQR